VWCTTGTIGSYLFHPRQGKSQLFRRNAHTMGDLREIFANPRVHGYGGYHERAELERREQPAEKRQRTVACPGCGRMHYTMGDTAQHFESGSCPSCPGQENARRAAYALARQREQQAGQQGLFTNGGPALLTFNGDGAQDFTQGYQEAGLNYHCPACGKGFKTMGGMINHVQARPQCQQSGGHLALGFR
jgi:ribosomal protein L44E